MKALLLLFFWASFWTPNLQAESPKSVWAEMETYIVQHLDEPIPDEAKITELFKIQSEEPQVEGKKIIALVRRNYWQKKFIADNQERFTEAKEADKKNMLQLVENPDLAETCPLNIAIIIDRSGKMIPDRITNIKDGLLAFVSNIIGTGNSLTFIGMGDRSPAVKPAIISQTVPYNPGNPDIHTEWINDVLSFANFDNDSWSTGLEAAIELNPDLVLMMTDGNRGQPDDEGNLVTAAAETLKSNGAHLFVFGLEGAWNNSPYRDYGDPSVSIEFSEAVDLFIEQESEEASEPPTFLGISTNDCISLPFDNNFIDLSSWFSNFQFPDTKEVTTTNIMNQPCDGDFSISGDYLNCQGAPITSIKLRIRKGFQIVANLTASVNTNDNTWSFSAPFSQLESLGLEYGNSYDVNPIMTLSDGTVIFGGSFIPGFNNDFSFEMVDCCAVNASFNRILECVREGEVFTVVVGLEGEGNITMDEIEEIYTSNNNYTYVEHSLTQIGDITFLSIDFISNTCTCEGEMLIFDIRLVACENVIEMMTGKIPCCVDECETVLIKDWYSEDCTIVNGNPARYFCLEVSSADPITETFATTNDVFCQTTLVDLEITNIGGTNKYSICGFMIFDDPNCTSHAKVSLQIETTSTCCLIEQSFSFPNGCELEEDCLESAPNLEIIIKGIEVSIDIPKGEEVSVFDHIANSTNTYTVGLVHCGPFSISIGGGVNPGPLDCTGIILPTPSMADCSNIETSDPIVNYHYEIEWNNCVWHLIGNLCNELIVLPVFPGGISTKGRDTTVEEEISFSDPIKVFPNPTDQSGLLNFDFGSLKTPVSNIEVRDVSGKIMDSFVPTQGQNRFQYQLHQPLSKGIYFLVFRMEDGQVRSTKLVSLD